MGSSGSGRFSDYPGTPAKKTTGDGSGIEGGTSGIDKCKQAFNVLLEDVGNSEYFSKTNTVPAVGDELSILFDKKRVFAINTNGLKIGALPTSFNYLVSCLENGIAYIGVVSNSSTSPIPVISADFAPK